MPQRATTQVRTADNPELLRTLKASLLDLQLKKIQLLTKFEPTHRLVQEVEQQIRQAESTIASQTLLRYATKPPTRMPATNGPKRKRRKPGLS